jgi:hypothetical protein
MNPIKAQTKRTYTTSMKEKFTTTKKKSLEHSNKTKKMVGPKC